MSKSLPPRPNLEQLKHQAKDLRKQFLADEPVAIERVSLLKPESKETNPSEFRLHDAQSVIAREYGFASWAKLKDHIESIQLETGEPLELLKQAFHDDDAPWLRKLLNRF